MAPHSIHYTFLPEDSLQYEFFGLVYIIYYFLEFVKCFLKNNSRKSYFMFDITKKR